MVSRAVRNIVPPVAGLLVVAGLMGYATWELLSGDSEDLQSTQSSPQSTVAGGRGSVDQLQSVEVVDGVSEFTTKDIAEAGLNPHGASISESGEVVDASFPDEFYTFMLDQIRTEWGDGLNPQLTTATSTQAFARSVKTAARPLPNLSLLSASALTGDMRPGDGFLFKDAQDRPVISLVFDSTLVNPGDNNSLRVASVAYPDHSPLYEGKAQTPLNNRQIVDMRDRTNSICANLYTNSGASEEHRKGVVGGYFASPIEVPTVNKVEFYQAKYLYLEHNMQDDSVSFTCAPMTADSSITVAFTPTGQNSYVASRLTVQEEK